MTEFAPQQGCSDHEEPMRELRSRIAIFFAVPEQEQQKNGNVDGITTEEEAVAAEAVRTYFAQRRLESPE